jgi:hypothetical protein
MGQTRSVAADPLRVRRRTDDPKPIRDRRRGCRRGRVDPARKLLLAPAGFTDCFQGASAQLIRGREDRVWPSRPVQEPYRGFVPALAAEPGADDWTGRQIVRLESIAPSSFARLWNRFARFTDDQRDRLVTVNGDEMLDKIACTLPGARAYCRIADYRCNFRRNATLCARLGRRTGQRT